MLTRLNAWLYHHYGCAFLLMGASFLVFGVLSLNLIYVLKANIELILEHGTMVIADGAGRQFLELMGYGYLSLAFFVVFKCCEHIVVCRLTQQGLGGPRH
jgi:ribose 1,5-bisphosphokinase PhnN